MLEAPLENIPVELHMMQHISRTAFTNHAKCLFNTETVLTMQQHMVQSCLADGYCNHHYTHASIGN